MARTRLPDPQGILSWEDVDRALIEIARAEIEIAKIEGDMNIEINGIKERADRDCAPRRARIEELGKALKAFAELNRPDFGKQKSRKLTFGTLGWRASTSIQVKTALVDHIIGNLRKLGMEDCVKVSETVNKEVLSTYPEDKIIASGATLKKSNTFWYETDKAELADAN